jgi:hypothetical protein
MAAPPYRDNSSPRNDKAIPTTLRSPVSRHHTNVPVLECPLKWGLCGQQHIVADPISETGANKKCNQKSQ